MTGRFMLPPVTANVPRPTPTIATLEPPRKWFIYTTVSVSALYLCIFLFADGSGLPRLTENLRYLMGTSPYSYTDIRRVMFADSTYEALAARTRFTLTPILFSLVLACAYAASLSKFVWLPLTSALFVICASQASKFPIVYFAALFALTYVYAKNSNSLNILTPRRIVFALIMLIIGFVLMHVLYTIQYREALEKGSIEQDDIARLLWYRPFFAVSDALYLWFQFFPLQHEHIGLSGIDFLARLFGLEYLDPTDMIPQRLLGADLTSMQTGFIGSGYASFGYLGIGVYSFLAGIVVWIISEVPFHLTNGIFRTVGFAVLGLNMYFLTSRQLHTALASGGLLSTALVLLILAECVRRTQSSLTVHFHDHK